MIPFCNLTWIALAIGTLATVAHSAESRLPVPAWTPDPGQREHLRRSLTLLAQSTPERRHTVRVLFYGQSITQQAWWKSVADYLRSTYTNANLVIENRAIGGHSSQLLVKTAEADLYPFQPDLVIFHVYGSHIEYENIIRRIRERTCADILLQTDHVTRDEALEEETDASKLTPAKWDAWMNHGFLPSIAEKYGACRADVHQQWKAYLKAHSLKAAALLRDAVHLNEYGDWLMAELLKPYLAPLPPKSGYDPLNNSAVRTLPLTGEVGQPYQFKFTGNRVDLVWKPGAPGSFPVQLNGTAPSAAPGFYQPTRVSAFPGSDWPILLQVGSAAPRIPETWSLIIDNVQSNGALCHFQVKGSKTGDDGEGWSTNRFVSKSGRVVIEPSDWNLAYSIAVFKRALPDGHTATWEVKGTGMDIAVPPRNAQPGLEQVTTVISGLPNKEHEVVLPLKARLSLAAVRFYRPALTTP